jgi:hypothetical protein
VAQIFISYKHVEPDQSLAMDLANAISKQHQVFIDSQIPLGRNWGEIIDEHLGGADFLAALVSEDAACSPMVVAEIEQAHRLNVATKRPGIIPIRLRFEGQLRYPLSAYVNRFQQCTWNGPGDTARITSLVLTAIESKHERLRPAAQRQQIIRRVRADWIHEDSWSYKVCMGGILLASVGLFTAMEKGGYFLLDHFASRYLLYRKNLMPWRMTSFLDTSAERLFLRKVGGGYIFVHRSIQEYFANLSN